jgi:hemolysin activation/secretion protein
MEVMAPGFRTEAETFYFFETWDVRERYGSVRGLAAGYFPLGSRSLLAVEIEGKKVYGEYPFFEAASLGGRGSIGGYKANRYSGDSSLLGSTELRFRVARLKFPIPGTVGVLGGANVGRVFWEDEDSSKWHPAAGGGVFFEMLRGLSVFSLSFWRGRDDTTFHFRAGFDF